MSPSKILSFPGGQKQAAKGSLCSRKAPCSKGKNKLIHPLEQSWGTILQNSLACTPSCP